VHGRFIRLQQNRQYDVSCRMDIGRNLSSADGTSNNRGRNARFGCVREFGKFVAGQGTPALAIEKVWRGAIDIL